MVQDAHNLLRPETMESLFVMWRVTRDAMYREWGWLMFRAWHKFSRVATGGYTSLDSVLEVCADLAVCCIGHHAEKTLADDGVSVYSPQEPSSHAHLLS